jgi:hypothetical protein
MMVVRWDGKLHLIPRTPNSSWGFVEENTMRRLIAVSCGLAALAFVIGGSASGAKEKDKKEMTVKEIMAKAHGKDGLRKKVIDGKASNDEKKALIDMYTALAALKCPMGNEKDWKKRTQDVVKLAASGDVADLKKIDCKGCHEAHRPPDE